MKGAAIGLGLNLSLRTHGTGGGSVLPIAGDLEFGPQGNTSFPVYVSTTGYLVPAGKESIITETWLPGQPVGWRQIWANGWGMGNGVVPLERAPADAMTLNWGSLFSGFAGSGFIADVPYAEAGPAVPAGGFTISDGLPAVSDGAVARTLLTSPSAGYRVAGYGFNTIGEGQRGADLASKFNAQRTGSTVAAAGTNGLNNAECLQMAGIVRPRVAGARSFLLLGTSIMKGQNTSYRDFLSPGRNTYGYAPVGLDSAVNGRMGWWQASINGSRLANQDQNISGEMAQRYAIITWLKNKNNGRWPFTDGLLDPRNDLQAINGTDAIDTLNQWIAFLQAEIPILKALLPGLPLHIVDLPPIESSATFSTWFATDLVNQVPAGGNYKAAAVKLFNAWIAVNYANLGLASVCPAGSAACAPDDGSGIAKVRLTPFTLAGGGTIDVADYPTGLASGTNLATTGVIITAPVAPDVGTNLILEPGLANVEGVGFSAAFSRNQILTVTPAGAGKHLIKLVAGTTTKTHPAGSVVKTCGSQEGTHPEHYVHQVQMAQAVIDWKATLPSLAA